MVPHVVEAAELSKREWTPLSLEEEARSAARKYGVNEKEFVRTMSCESMQFTETGQSHVPSSKGPNGRENSWGVAQFYLTHPLTTPDGTLITKEIATDPVQALDAAAWHFSEGRAGRWSCY